MTQGRFDSFVIFAEMRTGSNFLEANLNALDGVACHGEAFNPHFIGYPDTVSILGIDQAHRDSDPSILLHAIRNQDGALGGFRYFHDHDPRILEACLADPRVAKIILTRNPVDRYVSWCIAQQTGQWKLTDMKARKDGRAHFDVEQFTFHHTALQQFQAQLLNHLQRTGQTAFYVDYDDLQSVEIINGVAAFLGIEHRLEKIDTTLKVQNPSQLSEKVSNFDEMQAALAGFDRFNLTRTPDFEPRRGAAIPTYIAAAHAPLLYIPIKGGPEAQVAKWMATIDGVSDAALHRKMSQKQVRQWKRQNPGHRSFTVLRDPARRAHHAFCKHILSTGPESYPAVRHTLRKRYNLPIPQMQPDESWNRDDHRSAFLAFLAFLKGNLNGQTALRVDAAWGTQAQALQGIGTFMVPDYVFREQDLEHDLNVLLDRIGYTEVSKVSAMPPDTPFALEEIYDESVEQAVRAAYQRDYMMFGFDQFTPL